jgi:hypothetical protein
MLPSYLRRKLGSCVAGILLIVDDVSHSCLTFLLLLFTAASSLRLLWTSLSVLFGFLGVLWASWEDFVDSASKRSKDNINETEAVHGFAGKL